MTSPGACFLLRKPSRASAVRIAIVVHCTLFCTLVGSGARADGSDPASAEALFREGRLASQASNYAVACPKFEESNRLDPSPGALLNLADCEESLGQLGRAWQHFLELYDELPGSDPRSAIAEARAQALERRAPKLTIVLTSSALARVTRDDVVLGQASLGTRLPVDPGHHVIVVASPGRVERRYEVAIGEGEDKAVSVSPGEPLQDANAPGPQPPPAVEAGHELGARRTAAFVLGGLGAASLVTGATLGVIALSHLASSNADCTNDVCSNQGAVDQFRGAQSFGLAADVTLGVGIVLIGTAAVLAFTGSHGPGTQSADSWPAWARGRF